MAQATHPPPHGTETASWCSNTLNYRIVSAQPLNAHKPAYRPLRRVPALGCALGERLLAVSLAGSNGDRCTVTASAEAINSWTRRQFYHCMVPGQHLDAQAPAHRPTKRV